MSNLAERILRDIRAQRPFEPREDEIDGLDHAYRVQAEVTEALMADVPGRRIAGYKIAFNRRSSLDYYGLDEPCYAPLFSDQLHRSGASLPLAGFDDPLVEPEIAILLSGGLSGRPDTLFEAIGAFLPAIEVMDARGAFARDPSAAAAVAQRIHSEGAILGEARPAAYLDVGDMTVRLLVDGTPANEAKGAAPQSPLAALAWLASRLARDGRPLESGMVVLTGSHLPGRAIRQRCRLQADLDPLGSVSVDWV